MRAWGRVYAEDGSYTWVEVSTTETGDNSAVYLVELIQVLKMSRNESPFYANWGIPAQLSVIQQFFPDIYVFQTQQQFSPFFLSLIVARLPGFTNPTYRINATTFAGATLDASSVPQ